MEYSLPQNLAPLLLDWYEENRRILPWREDPQPYRVWVSEIMLQQTRVEAVLPYFARFMEALPSISALAAAPEEQLLKLWEGLGYYSRVRNLQKAAKIVMEQHDGQLPSDYDALLKLPGIGEYTAGAIRSIAFGQPEPAVDGNVLRICSRICADERDSTSPAFKKHYREALRPLYPNDRAAEFTQALMELGATVCLPNGAPLCRRCPLQHCCAANLEENQLAFPVKPAKKQRKIENRTVWLIRCGEKILLHKRPSKGLLAGLWEFPNTLNGEELPLPISTENAADCGTAKHIFSHIEWHMNGKNLAISREISTDESYIWVSAQQLREEYAVPSAFAAFTKQLLWTI